MSDDKGVFTISLDTELAWGTFNQGNVDRHEKAYRNTPEVIDRLGSSSTSTKSRRRGRSFLTS